MKTIVSLVMLLLTVFSVKAQEKQTDYAETLKLIEVWLDAQRDYDHIPGMSVIIVDDQET